MAGTLDDLQVAAALAEMIYRRNAADQPIALTDIAPSEDDNSVVTPESLTKDGDGFYYDDATGFVGRVVEAGAGRAPRERPVEAFLQPGDERGGAERPAGALGGADRLALVVAQPSAQEFPRVRQEPESATSPGRGRRRGPPDTPLRSTTASRAPWP